MSIPYPLNNSTLPHEGASPDPQLDAPIKPFRSPIIPKKTFSVNQEVLRSLLNDNKELKRVLLYGLAAIAIIVGSIVAKTTFTFATLALMFLAIFGLALVDSWSAIYLFTVYLSLEGMYKYTSNFSPVVYIIAPFLSITIFVAWRLRSRQIIEKRESREKMPEKVSLFQAAQHSREFGLPPIAPWVLALLALCVLQTANPDSPGLLNSLNGAVVWYMGPMSFFFITYFALEQRREAMGFIYTMIVTGFVVSAYAVIQFYLGEGWVNAHVPGMENMARFSYGLESGGKYEEGSYRPASTAAIVGGYVIASCMAMLAALSVATTPRLPVWRRTVALLSTSAVAMALAVSGVRQVVLNLCVVIPILLSLSVRRFEDVIRIYFMVFAIGGLLGVSFMTADLAAGGKLTRRYASVFTGNPLDNYAQNRGNSMTLIPEAVMARPLGIGIRRGTRGNVDILRGDLKAFNNRETQWNAVQSDLGIFGLICLAGYFITALYQGGRICRTLQDPNLRSIAILMYAVVVFNFIASLGSTVLLSNYTFWTASGILFALPRIAVNERKLLLKPVVAAEDEDGGAQKHVVA